MGQLWEELRCDRVVVRLSSPGFRPWRWVDSGTKAGLLLWSLISTVTRDQTLNRHQEVSGNLVTLQPLPFSLNMLPKLAENIYFCSFFWDSSTREMSRVPASGLVKGWGLRRIEGPLWRGGKWTGSDLRVRKRVRTNKILKEARLLGLQMNASGADYLVSCY